MSVLKIIGTILLVSNVESFAMEKESPSVLSSAKPDIIKKLNESQTLEEAVGVITDAYPKYDILTFLNSDAGDYLDILRSLADKENNKDAARKHILSLLSHNLSPLSIAQGEGENLHSDYKSFVDALFNKSIKWRTAEEKKVKRDQRSIDTITNYEAELSSGKITTDEYFSKLIGSVSSLFKKLGTEGAFDYIKEVLMTLSHSNNENKMSIDRANHAQQLYFVVFQELKQRPELMFRLSGDRLSPISGMLYELLNVVLNKYYMEIPDLPLQEKLRLSLPLILSNPEFAQEYLDKILKYSLVETPQSSKESEKG